MIVSAEFKNFRALRDVKIDLEPFTVIVGPNSCGKSTLLEGLSLIINGNKTNLRVFQKNVSKGSEGNSHITGLLINHKNDYYNFTISEGGFVVQRNQPPNQGQYITLKVEGILLAPEKHSMSQPSYTSTLKPKIEFDGRGLSTVFSIFQQEIQIYT